MVEKSQRKELGAISKLGACPNFEMVVKLLRGAADGKAALLNVGVLRKDIARIEDQAVRIGGRERRTRPVVAEPGIVQTGTTIPEVPGKREVKRICSKVRGTARICNTVSSID